MSPDLQKLIIQDILNATMPDGSPIRPEVKADALLSQLVPGAVSPSLHRLFTMGVQAATNQIRRSRTPFYA